MKIWEYLSGWKTIIAWLLMQIPALSDYPGIVSAIQEAIANGNRQTYINLAIQILMAVGVGHRALKNIK